MHVPKHGLRRLVDALVEGDLSPDPLITDAVLKSALQAVRSALGLLLEAHWFARRLQCDVWEFALATTSLVQAGATESVLRWLIYSGQALHGIERTRDASLHRVVRHVSHLWLTDRSCIVLSDAGVNSAVRVAEIEQQILSADAPHPESNGTVKHLQKPEWDKQRRELWLDGRLVKRFRQPACDQELVLNAFQELEWPARMDDPIPVHRGIDSKKRLHDTIMRLNKHQVNHLMRFVGDGSGRAIGWERSRAIKFRATNGEQRQSADRGAIEQRRQNP